MTLAILPDTGAGPNLVNNDFFLRGWWGSAKSRNLPPLRTADCIIATVKSSYSGISRGTLIWDWKNTGVDVLLVTLFSDRYIRQIFTAQRTSCLLHSRPWIRISTNLVIKSLNADIHMLNVNKKLSGNAVCDRHSLYLNDGRSMILTYTQSALLFCSQGAELMVIETDCITVEHQCPMTTRGH